MIAKLNLPGTLVLCIVHVLQLLLYPQRTKYVEGYIVFGFPSVRPSVCACICMNVNILHQSFA